MPEEHEQPLSGDTIARDLRSLALQAKRCPQIVHDDSHWSAAHRDIDKKLDEWEVAQLEVPC